MAEHRVDKLLDMLKCGVFLYPWQIAILKKNQYVLVCDCHGSDLYCIGCGVKQSRCSEQCVLAEEHKQRKRDL